MYRGMTRGISATHCTRLRERRSACLRRRNGNTPAGREQRRVSIGDDLSYAEMMTMPGFGSIRFPGELYAHLVGSRPMRGGCTTWAGTREWCEDDWHDITRRTHGWERVDSPGPRTGCGGEMLEGRRLPVPLRVPLHHQSVGRPVVTAFALLRRIELKGIVCGHARAGNPVNTQAVPLGGTACIIQIGSQTPCSGSCVKAASESNTMRLTPPASSHRMKWGLFSWVLLLGR